MKILLIILRKFRVLNKILMSSKSKFFIEDFLSQVGDSPTVRNSLLLSFGGLAAMMAVQSFKVPTIASQLATDHCGTRKRIGRS